MKSALAQCRALCDRAGFDPGCVTDALLEAAIRRRSIVRGAARTEDYAALLSANNEEQTELLEELLVTRKILPSKKYAKERLTRHYPIF